ncbi:urate oxidase [Solirubrobacter taibaiensis]|nr:urate oxidase [Solirubrobacter taibaiensis]
MTAAVRLGANQYGKAEVRIVKVTRTTPVHEIEDLNVTSQLRGDFTATHLTGDNALVVATDTQKNTIYGLAREHGIGSPEDFLLLLGRHFTGSFDWVTGGRWAADAYSWERIAVGGAPHDHAFVRSGQDTRTAVLDWAEGPVMTSGLTDLVVLKSTGSEFHGFPRDRFTTLKEASDRILATAVTASWRYATTELDYNALYTAIRQILLETFATTHSLALQQTLYAMGAAVLEAHDAVAEISMSMPNKHHFLVDLAPFDLDNPGEIFFAADRPYGLIEATVERAV